MKNRNPLAVLLLPIVTFGIYGIVWQVKTKNEMNSLGANIPTAWLIIVPLVNIWWLWKYCEGVGKVTDEKVSGVLAFILLFLLNLIGMAILQFEFNKIGNQPVAATAQPAAMPAPGFGGPDPVVSPTLETQPAATVTQPVVAGEQPIAVIEQPTIPTEPTTQPPQTPQV